MATTTSGSTVDGVAQLQLARSAALAKIDEARIRRAVRLKAAKDEAKCELDLFKTVRDEHLNQLEKQINSNQSELEDYHARMTDIQLDQIAKSYENNKEAALHLLISTILDVKPTFHVNFVPNGK